MVRLEIEEIQSKKAHLAPKLFKQLDIYEGDILSIAEPNTGKKIVALATKDNETFEHKVGLGREHIRSLGVDEGFTIEITPYREGLVPIRSIELGLAPASERTTRVEDQLLSVKKNERELLQFLGDRVFTINSKFEWDEYDLLISIEDTKPKLSSDDVARFGELEDFKYKWVGSEIKTFNGVLFIDISGSMKKKDMRCEGVDWAIERMEQEFKDPEARKFFQEIRGKKRISRLNGSLLAALKYLVEKIGRGVGEKIAVILYTTRAYVVDFGDGEMYYNSSQPTEDIASKLLKDAKETFHGKTNLLDALKDAREIIKDFPINKMKMFVVLTDGKVDKELECLEYFKDHIFPRGDIVVNTLGIGERINEDFLSHVANNSGGNYYHVENLRELVEKYSEYAMNLEIRGSSESIDSWKGSNTHEKVQQKTYNVPRCPSCSQGLSYYQDDWYCHGCQRYVGEINVSNLPVCSSCGKYLSYFDKNSSWYCYYCDRQEDI